MSAQQPKIEPWITDAARRVKQYPVAGLHGVEQIITEAYAAHLASGETKATDFPAILERERTLVAEGVTNIKKAIQCREWLTEGRGSYEWNDDRWHSEFAAAIAEIITALQPLERIAADWTNCPQTWEKVREARKELLGKPWNSASVPASEAPSAATPDKSMIEYWLRDYAQFRPNWWPLIEEYLESRAVIPASAAPSETRKENK